VYRQAIPAALAGRIPEHGSRRVLAAIAAELAARTPAELADRIGVRWQAWRYRTEDIADPTAVAITITRRGYHCPDIRCEDHVRIDTGQPCAACAQIAAARHHATATANPTPPSPAAPGTSSPGGRDAAERAAAPPGPDPRFPRFVAGGPRARAATKPGDTSSPGAPSLTVEYQAARAVLDQRTRAAAIRRAKASRSSSDETGGEA
jgi:hypothetical protein